jgi:hypothetical protein
VWSSGVRVDTIQWITRFIIAQMRLNPVNGQPKPLPDRSRGLKSVEAAQDGEPIQMDAILDDFTNTMNALGADDAVRHQVNMYLNVVRLQGQEAEPNVPLVKQTLVTAGKSLDQFITRSLGQPSDVVTDWVKALLGQSIDFKASSQPVGLPTPGGVPAPDWDKARLKTLIETGQTHHQQKRYPQAVDAYETALAVLSGKQRPDLEGKVHRLLGQVHADSGKLPPAVQAYTQAAQQFEIAQMPDKRARAHWAAAQLLADNGDPAEALSHLETAVSVQPAEPRFRLMMGQLQIRLGHPADGTQTLATALEQLPPGPDQTAARYDLALGERLMFRYDAARRRFEQVLSEARAQQNPVLVRDAQRQLAILELEQGRS